MKNQQSGFTLIELIAVIVILGILAATALPKFVDMSSAAAQAAADGVAGNLGSANALNYANAVALNAGVVTGVTNISVTNCTDSAQLIQGGLPTGYTITPAAIAGLGTSVSCTLTLTKGSTVKTANFQGIGVP